MKNPLVPRNAWKSTEGARRPFAAALLTLFLLTGCARHYNITLNNNHVVTTYSKPKLNKTGDAYVFKNQAGAWTAVPAGNVKLIEPRGHGSKPDAMFKPPQP